MGPPALTPANCRDQARTCTGRRTFGKVVAGTQANVQPHPDRGPASSTGWLATCGSNERGRSIAVVIQAPGVTRDQAWFGSDCLVGVR